MKGLDVSGQGISFPAHPSTCGPIGTLRGAFPAKVALALSTSDFKAIWIYDV